MGIREDMPVLARHEGEWHGTYTYLGEHDEIVDQHASVLRCTFPDADDHDYFQTNDYTWADGKTEHHEFPAIYRDRAIHFDTERIKGQCWEIDERCLVLHWVYQADTDVYLYELIHLDDGGKNRTRTWHWFRDGVCFQRTLIAERKVS
jgi:hypothetical protein